MKLGGGDIFKILQPYLSTRFIDQARAVVPLAIYLALFQYLVLQTPVMDASIISGGLFAVMIGLMMFGGRVEAWANAFWRDNRKYFASQTTLAGVLFIAFLLGIGVTFARQRLVHYRWLDQLLIQNKHLIYLHC